MNSDDHSFGPPQPLIEQDHMRSALTFCLQICNHWQRFRLYNLVTGAFILWLELSATVNPVLTLKLHFEFIKRFVFVCEFFEHFGFNILGNGLSTGLRCAKEGVIPHNAPNHGVNPWFHEVFGNPLQVYVLMI